jgi:hypothetical protein
LDDEDTVAQKMRTAAGMLAELVRRSSRACRSNVPATQFFALMAFFSYCSFGSIIPMD